jgi:hypothetical protein
VWVQAAAEHNKRQSTEALAKVDEEGKKTKLQSKTLKYLSQIIIE